LFFVAKRAAEFDQKVTPASGSVKKRTKRGAASHRPFARLVLPVQSSDDEVYRSRILR
jgi:hypothetical protein